jgi:hypothetical protein
MVYFPIPLLLQKEKYARSDTTLAQLAQSDTVTLTRTFSASGPKSYITLQILYWDSFSPTGHLIDLPAIISRNRVSRYHEPYMHVLVQLQIPNPDSQQSTLSTRWGFPYRDIATCGVANHSPHKYLNSECRSTRAIILHHVTSSLRLYRESRDRDFTDRNSFAPKNPERRTLTSQDLMPHVSAMIDGPDQIRESLLAISTGMIITSLNAEGRNPMGFCPSFLCLRIKPRATLLRSNGQQEFMILLCEPWPLFLPLWGILLFQTLPCSKLLLGCPTTFTRGTISPELKLSCSFN